MFTLRKQIFPLIVSIFILILAACAPQGGALPGTGGQTPSPQGPTATAQPQPGATSAVENLLANTSWQLATFGPQGSETPVIQGSTITLEFQKGGQVVGSGGCNSYGGDYQVQDGTLSFGQIIHTERACLDETLMQQENDFFQALQSAGKYELTADSLKIWYDNGQDVLNFVPETAAPTPGATAPAATAQPTAGG